MAVARPGRALKSKDRWVWIDCEMTGLDPDRHVLLEIATIITDTRLTVVATGPELVIRPTAAELKRMDPWPRRTHRKSGLLDRVATEGLSLKDAERQTLAFVRRHCYTRTAPLCGNSVWQDRRFLARYMPALERYLHYRIVDVSSIKVALKAWHPGKVNPPEKAGTHRALLDIEESIDELRYYRKHFMAPRTRTRRA
ncbi:MAG: oligoribonuclease [Vicinamibacterales bacterium]|nr:oligoribonuclease [Vicinamibacterales bacterium]